MRNARIPLMVLLLICVGWVSAPIEGVAEQEAQKIAMKDNCDPSDTAWNATGGCQLGKGDVTEAEFVTFLQSPLYNNAPVGSPPTLFLVGHPSWRNEPSHVLVETGKKIEVTNEGGRNHTFTPVAEFGGGRVPPLRVGTQMAPECALAPGTTDPYLVGPGGKLKLEAEGEGIMRFQCCLHPWMRATVRVTGE